MLEYTANNLLIFVFLCIFIGLGFVFSLIRYIIKQDDGSEKVREIANAIHKGAMAFLNKEYRIMLLFMVLSCFALLTLEDGKTLALMFVIGSFFSALSGRVGMYIATKANSRTAIAAGTSLNKALRIAFSSGVVMGLIVVSLGLLGISVFYYFYPKPSLIFGFAFGASFIALFARVGGGIFTKAADVGADLVGKVEKGIPEDDPRNPAVIADNVGDNVGDVAGMGADLFESYVASIVAAMAIAVVSYPDNEYVVLLPLLLSAFGIIASIFGTFFVRVREGKSVYYAMNKGIFASSLLMLIGSYFLIRMANEGLGIFFASSIGLFAGLVIGLSTQYYTSKYQKPTQSIALASTTGAGTTLIEGMSVGMFSTIIPVLTVGFSMLLSYYFAGIYGIAIAAVGMLSTLGITLAAETYGAVADNAQGIAEMAGLGKKTLDNTTELDSIGNTTAAIGKGFAIGSAALTSIVLYIEYVRASGIGSIDIVKPEVILGLFIGGLLPFVFCALLMGSVGKAASKIVEEARRQFKEIKGLMQGKAKPDVEKCIEISTHAALFHMAIPGMLIIIVPIFVGVFIGKEALGGLLVGKTVVGFLLAVFMANSGGAWDNAKKYIEAGNLGGKGSDAHKAAVIGDTVGDPFKDTAGPSLNILMKLMAIVAIVFVPLFV